MQDLSIPPLLTALAHEGKSGLMRSSDSRFLKELDLCREWGFKITTSKDRVFLHFDQDQLVPLWIRHETPAIAWDALRVHGFLRIGSTNDEALNQVRRGGAPDGTLIYAEEQTAGKGRRDRRWLSPPGAGLCFTLVLRPKQQPMKRWAILTFAASISLFEALKELSDRKVVPKPFVLDLKWPNDLLLSGKKCAGILCEMLSAENGNDAIVIGVGVNVRQESIPKSLEGEAVCLDAVARVSVPRRQLLVSFLSHFQRWYLIFEQGKQSELLERWKCCSSMWNGVKIHIIDGDTRRTAITCGLSEDGALIVRTSEGSVERILAGDISVRRFAD